MGKLEAEWSLESFELKTICYDIMINYHLFQKDKNDYFII